MQSILFRADGNEKLGLGHIVRCLALADALKNNNPDLDLTFITKYEGGKKIIEENNYGVIPVINDELSQIKKITDEETLIITDFLDTDNQYISKIKKITSFKVLSIDNNTKLKKIDADILINANVFDERDTKEIGLTKYFLGPKYMILRKEFEEMRKEKGSDKIRDKVETILVMFGGTDLSGFTINVAHALKNIPDDVRINLIVGPAFSYRDKLTTFLSKTNREFGVLSRPKNLIEIMKNADIAITAAGIALYEFATLGIPSIVIPQAKHQEDIAAAFERDRACLNIGVRPDDKMLNESTLTLMNNKVFREQLSKNAQKIVDGKGMKRVVKLIESER